MVDGHPMPAAVGPRDFPLLILAKFIPDRIDLLKDIN